ncbi:SusC/RagA family TonB-linked outer membrane protein [Pseudoflavitalea sp. X16]|uniref:SusC/RagA family TonB-linked outer membrane protein n=1 Tax=Paraflavitalea devenefica TaxID=2716334 RepID=UPI0014239D25|nr:SusC/RagA family TonB-linked outer membrane protein [Paraflavitalea devenefica]NII26291.1 SusC/RagA family TonB-linked outer membrane protein [Paraflavitalea devenefica]
MKKLIFCLPLLGCWLLLSLCVTAQDTELVVSGTVTRSAANEKLSNVTVTLKGTSLAAVTGAGGQYSLKVNDPKGILVFTYVGLQSREVPIEGRSRIDVALEPDNAALTDVVIVGYAQQSKTRITAAVSKLNPEELKNTANPNPVQAIQGKIAGVSVPISSGQPGAGAINIIIRGSTKLNAYGSGLGNSNGSQIGSSDANVGPLIVVDGIFRSSINDINPDNIESFQVMKDAASTAIYGARGANGVIVIKTRGGKFNSKMNLTLNHRTTWETPARSYKYIGATDYLRLARTTVKNTFDGLDKNNLLNNGGFSAGTRVYTAKGQYGRNINLTALYDNIVAIEGQAYVDNLLAKGWKTMDDPINPGTKLLYADNNYQDMLWVTGLTQNYNASIDGGSEKASYNVSAGYTDQKGTFVGTRYRRYDVLGNFNFKAADNFRIDAMINYQNVLPNFVDAYQNELVRGTRVTPLIRIYKDDGNPTPGELYTVRNRFHTLKYDDFRVSTERLIARVGGDLTIIKGLHWRPSFSYQMQDYRELFMRKGTPADEIQPSTQRQKNEYTENMRDLMTDQILQYDFDINGDHDFMVLGGFNYRRVTYNAISIGSQRANNDYIYTINEPTTAIVNGVITSNVTNFSTSLREERSASFFGQFTYDYQKKYLLGGSLRYDGFSNFAPGNRYALFPSISAGWNIHKEDFWNIKAISKLKLRASWGGSGLSDLSITDTYGGYGATQYANAAGVLRNNLSNPNLVWETTQTTDLALDAEFFKDRISLTIDFYNKLTKDRLAVKPLPSEAPFPSVAFNNGVLQNKGVEIELGGIIIDKKDFIWRSYLSFAYNRTVVKELPDNGRVRNRQGGDVVYDPTAKQLVEAGGIAEGERPFALYAYKVLGVFATEAEAAAWNAKTKDNLASPSGQTVKKHAGDFIFADVNGDGIIDTKDQVFMGYRTPDKIGGMQNILYYKGITLRFTVDYALGHLISNGALARSLGQGRAFNEGAPSEALGSDIWQKEGDAGKKYARFSFADFDFGQRNYLRGATLGVNQSYSSDVSVMIGKGDFLAFREIGIAYDLPRNLLKKVHATGVNVFASVYNLGYITKYKGQNPESYTGFDPGGYPRPRQFSLGATVRF